MIRRYLSLCTSLLALVGTISAQSKTPFRYDTTLYNKMLWREIGPYRAGRSIAVAGHRDKPLTYYFGATGGGVWKSDDGGISWINVSDKFFKLGIVGALAVAQSDPNVVYAGTGEACIRGNAMPGEGVYRSVDAGKSWKFSGLKDAQTISKIIVHPGDENIVYAAAFGHVFGPNPDRGVYRSKDGGSNWEKILYKSEKAGAVDIAMDPSNPRILYAALWEAYRNPWSMSSGGPSSSLWKSTDGGDSWVDLMKSEGFPKGVLGKIGIAVSPARADRLWIIVEAEEGGLFRSDDGGKSWSKMSDDRRIRQRAWYYSHIFADPLNPEVVYILNVQFFKSIDGGHSLATLSVPHGDNHDLWIDPSNPLRMIEGNDGGATVTVNGGQTWTEEDVPTAQFYHVAVDSAFPYNVYGAQQDNSTVRIASRTTGFGIDRTDWYAVGGGESGYIAVDPKDPEITYAGSYDGYLTRYDHHNDQEQDVSPWPDNPMGGGAGTAKYRFQWTFPIVVSQHDPKVVYATANRVFRTTNEGMSWHIISPDLTRNDTSKLGASGGPITKDNTSVEYYGTIFTFAESPVQQGVLWAGSDDGMVHMSRDGGTTWLDITPKDLPPWSMMSIVEPSPHDPGTAYLAANRYKLDDFRPYLFRTTDFGKSWKRIVRGIPEMDFTHVIREDPNRRGLLYAGTERGIHVSFDAGENWQPLQLNLPVTPIHDIAVQGRERDLVVATHGRSFWILDDLTPLYQLNDNLARSEVILFKPRDSYRMGGFSFDRPGLAIGKNPPGGVVVYYYFKKKPQLKDSVRIEFLDDQGRLVKSFRHREEKAASDQAPLAQDEGPNLAADSGMNRFVWDMRYADAASLPGLILWGGTTRGPTAVPGIYHARLSCAGKNWSQAFLIKKDPRLRTTQAEFEEQFAFLMKVRDTLSTAHQTVLDIREIRNQTSDLVKRLDKHAAKDSVERMAKSLNEKLKRIEEEIVQIKIKSGQDALNFPIKLNNKIAALASVASSADSRPTEQTYSVFTELTQRLSAQIHDYKAIRESDLVKFNQCVRALEIPAVILKPPEHRETR